MDPIPFMGTATTAESMVTLQPGVQNLERGSKETVRAAARGGTPYGTAQ